MTKNIRSILLTIQSHLSESLNFKFSNISKSFKQNILKQKFEFMCNFRHNIKKYDNSEVIVLHIKSDWKLRG